MNRPSDSEIEDSERQVTVHFLDPNVDGLPRTPRIALPIEWLGSGAWFFKTAGETGVVCIHRAAFEAQVGFREQFDAE